MQGMSKTSTHSNIMDSKKLVFTKAKKFQFHVYLFLSPQRLILFKKEKYVSECNLKGLSALENLEPDMSLTSYFQYILLGLRKNNYPLLKNNKQKLITGWPEKTSIKISYQALKFPTTIILLSYLELAFIFWPFLRFKRVDIDLYPLL